MADVLLARTDGIEGFERHVVLKRIRAEYARDPLFIKMFLDEARVAANLHHQHIVQVNDIGESNGNYFFAMEYLHGEDVRAMLTAAAKARMHIPLGVVVAIGSAAAAGLHYAHERRANDRRPLNIVHCDVSPSNILVGYDGSIKVVDFGIAKAALRTEESRHVKGKASYMSPEQCTAGSIDRRSDVFSLGIVLFELATTTRLFKGTGDDVVMDAIVKGRAPLPRVRRPDLPNELSMIIMRALDTDPSRRFQTAEDLRLALDRFAVGAGLNTSAAAVSSVLKKMFGERPEPWLDLHTAEADEAGRSWVEMPQIESGRARRPSELATGAERLSQVVPARATMPLPLEPPRAMTEPGLPVVPAPARARSRKLAVGGAVLAAAGAAVVAVVLAGGDPAATPAVATAAQAQITVPASPAATPTEAAGAAAPAATPAAAPVASAAPVPEDEIEIEMTAEPPSAATSSRGRSGGAAAKRSPGPARSGAPDGKASSPTSEVAALAAAPAAAPSAATAPASAPAAMAAAAPPSAPAAPPSPAIATPAKPAVATAPAIPQVPQGMINRVAWDHSKDLAKCDDKESGKGEVTVKFHVTPDGRVTKPQIASQMGKPRLAACILRSLQKWKFPRQASTGADATYTIIF